ncbi:MAG: 30S ribosomal protein S12 methylthiotransferase RimO, partial [Planctomycetota bacterium]|nr:30S ribosomal protein S12 methylthiotransferase RimO [Planctomycetota bacterium]
VIDQMLALKHTGLVGRVIVAGCLAERDGAKLLDARPEIDHVLGVFARDEITTIAKLEASGQPVLLRPQPNDALLDDNRMALTPGHLAYLKIAEGCDRSCAFCSIPSIRGRYSSKPMDVVVAEARRLARGGVRELIVIAQDTSYYGHDLHGRPMLAELLRRLDRIEDVDWIRVMYLYPNMLSDELIDVVAGGERILPYLDIPLQHINAEVLRRMRRGIDRAKTEDLLTRLRDRIEGLVLRTTLMTGFPGETEAQFQELLDFVAEVHFERLGAFAYREEAGTPSMGLDGCMPIEVREARREALLAAQQPISAEFNQVRVGRRLEILLDSDIVGENNAHIGRSAADAPEVDGVVYVTGEGLRPGQMVGCEVVAAQQYDLIAVAIEPPK